MGKVIVNHGMNHGMNHVITAVNRHTYKHIQARA